MSIRADVTELQSIRAEIDSLNKRRRNLLKKEKEVQARIDQYLDIKGQPGLTHHGVSVRIVKKEGCAPKKNKERDQDACSVLQQHGVQNPEKVLRAVMAARKGEKITKRKLKLSKVK